MALVRLYHEDHPQDKGQGDDHGVEHPRDDRYEEERVVNDIQDAENNDGLKRVKTHAFILGLEEEKNDPRYQEKTVAQHAGDIFRESRGSFFNDSS